MWASSSLVHTVFWESENWWERSSHKKIFRETLRTQFSLNSVLKIVWEFFCFDQISIISSIILLRIYISSAWIFIWHRNCNKKFPAFALRPFWLLSTQREKWSNKEKSPLRPLLVHKGKQLLSFHADMGNMEAESSIIAGLHYWSRIKAIMKKSITELSNKVESV